MLVIENNTRCNIIDIEVGQAFKWEDSLYARISPIGSDWGKDIVVVSLGDFVMCKFTPPCKVTPVACEIHVL